MNLRKIFAVKNHMQYWLLVGFLIILVLLPFHGLISTWLGDVFGYEILFKTWKELLLTLMMLFFAVALYRQPKVFSKILQLKINQLILVFFALHSATWLIFQPDIDAAMAGVLINTRYLIMFLLAQWLAQTLNTKRLQDYANKVVFGTALVVAAFAILQFSVLPDDFMANFGYGPNSIPAAFNIDSNDNLQRVASTLRGPNPLGSFMILPLTLAAAWFIRDRSIKYAAAFTMFGLALVFSFSRSAWLGAFIAVALVVYLSLNVVNRKRMISYTVPLAILAVLVVAAFSSQSTIYSRFVLHDDPNSGQSDSSTTQHLEAYSRTANRIIEDPLGDGPGSAGPASFYNDDGKEITENYFLQLGREVGIIGMVVFMAISTYLALYFWRNISKPNAKVLFASLLGLSIANLFLGVWTDESTAMIWWAIAGLNVNLD